MSTCPTSRSIAMGDYPHFAGVSDDAWLSMLERSVKEPLIDGIEFPRFPSEAMQAASVGSANATALREASVFYRTLKTFSGSTNNPLEGDSRVLDFGCGWGRFLRFLWKDVKRHNIYGVDPDPDFLELCRTCGSPGHLSRIEPRGRLNYPDAHFSHVMAYSVFTHLPRDIHLHWMAEIARTLRPGGTFALTLEPRRFLDFIASLRSRTIASPWYEALFKFAANVPAYRAIFDSGELAYLPTGGGKNRPPEVYGDAVVPLAFIQRHWSEHFEVIDYIDDSRRFFQAVLIVRRNGTRPAR